MSVLSPPHRGTTAGVEVRATAASALRVRTDFLRMYRTLLYSLRKHSDRSVAAVLLVAQLPARAHIPELVIKPTCAAFS